jgi:hypothetical protein
MSLLESQFSSFDQRRHPRESTREVFKPTSTTTARISPRSVVTSSSLSPSFKFRPAQDTVALFKKMRPFSGRILIPHNRHYEDWPLDETISASSTTSCSIQTMEKVYEGCTEKMRARILMARNQRATGSTQYFSDPGPELYRTVEGDYEAFDDNDDDDETQVDTEEPIFDMDL